MSARASPEHSNEAKIYSLRLCLYGTGEASVNSGHLEHELDLLARKISQCGT